MRFSRFCLCWSVESRMRESRRAGELFEPWDTVEERRTARYKEYNRQVKSKIESRKDMKKKRVEKIVRELETGEGNILNYGPG